MLPCSSYSACGLLSRHNFVGGRKWKPMATNAGVEPCPFRQKQTIQQVAACCCQWQPCTRHRGFVICVSVRLLCYVFLSFFFFFLTCVLPCFCRKGRERLRWPVTDMKFQTDLRKCTRESYFLRVVVFFAVHAWNMHMTWFRPAGHGGMKTPLKLSLYPHDATHCRTLVVCSSFAPFPKICFQQTFYRFQKSVVFFLLLFVLAKVARSSKHR